MLQRPVPGRTSREFAPDTENRPAPVWGGRFARIVASALDAPPPRLPPLFPAATAARFGQQGTGARHGPLGSGAILLRHGVLLRTGTG
ncbi:hypothetical protein TPA0908_48930 [Micromonospora sp. AKA38]|nr:hypothetical protein TPA0908_48930 [Micromonospora sp. AKA38]